ncbi:MAG: hypothetical protein ACOYNI_08875 [Acidimicrobiia bacterium]
MKRVVALVTVALTLLVLTAPAAHAGPSDDARRDAERILGDGRGGSNGGQGSSTSTTASRPRTTTPRPTPRPTRPPDASAFKTIGIIVAIALGVVILGLLLWGIIRRIRNRGPKDEDDEDALETSTLGLTEEDAELLLSPPEQLERLADEAERNGDFARAYRLRFRAGLLRLADAGVVTLDPALTTGQLRRKLQRDRFDGLAYRFDEIVYGEAPADSGDTNTARTTWPQLITEVKS